MVTRRAKIATPEPTASTTSSCSRYSRTARLYVGNPATSSVSLPERRNECGAALLELTMTSLQTGHRRAAAPYAALAVAAAAAFASTAAAQTPREAIRDLVPGSTPTELTAVASAVIAQIASVPIGSSSGAFTLVQNPVTGE